MCRRRLFTLFKSKVSLVGRQVWGIGILLLGLPDSWKSGSSLSLCTLWLFFYLCECVLMPGLSYFQGKILENVQRGFHCFPHWESERLYVWKCPIMLCSLCTVLLPCLALLAKVICAALKEYRMHNYSERTPNMPQNIFNPFTLTVTVCFTSRRPVFWWHRGVTNHALHVDPPIPSLRLVSSVCSALQSSFLSKLPPPPHSPFLSLSFLPWLDSYLCPHGLVHQLVLPRPDWASEPAFPTSKAQVSSVSTS